MKRETPLRVLGTWFLHVEEVQEQVPGMGHLDRDPAAGQVAVDLARLGDLQAVGGGNIPFNFTGDDHAASVDRAGHFAGRADDHFSLNDQLAVKFAVNAERTGRSDLSLELGFLADDRVDRPGGMWLAFRAEYSVSPDGTRSVFTADDSLGQTSLYLRNLDQPEPTLVPGTAGAVVPFFSPDGQHIGYHQDGRLRRVALAGGTATTIVETGYPTGAAWGGYDRIVYARPDGLWRVPATGGSRSASSGYWARAATVSSAVSVTITPQNRTDPLMVSSVKPIV